MELLERMKKNLAEFGCLGIEQKNLLKNIGKENCELLADYGEWIKNLPGGFCDKFIYRILSDYQPEPEIPVLEGYVLIKIFSPNGNHLLFDGHLISVATNNPNFVGYAYKLKGMKEIVITGSNVLYTNKEETNWSLVRSLNLTAPLRPSWVVLKESK